MSIPISQFIPSPPCPAWYSYLCSLHLCLYLCFVKKIIYTKFFRFHIYTLIYSVCFSSCWTQYSFSRSVSVGVTVAPKVSFLYWLLLLFQLQMLPIKFPISIKFLIESTAQFITLRHSQSHSECFKTSNTEVHVGHCDSILNCLTRLKSCKFHLK